MPTHRARPAVPERHLLDRRALQILAAEFLPGIGHNPPPTLSDDDLLSTAELAKWLGVSTQWLEIGRSKGYGPPFRVLGPRCIKYRRGDVRVWLQERAYTCTAEYRNRNSAEAHVGTRRTTRRTTRREAPR